MSERESENPPAHAQTGRGVKLVQLAGALVLCAGVVTCIVWPAYILAGANAVFFGLCLWLAGRIAAWWKYG